MWRDPIIEETRERREQLAALFDHNPDAIFEGIRARQSEEGKQVVSFPPRVPKDTPTAA